MTYSWNATVPRGEAAAANATAVAAALDALASAAARAGETFSMTSEEMAAVAAFSAVELELTLENFLGGASKSDVFVVKLSAETLPNVQIVGGAYREIVVNRVSFIWNFLFKLSHL